MLRYAVNIVMYTDWLCVENEREREKGDSQLLLIQPITDAKGSLNRRDNKSSNDTRRC